MNVTLRLKRLRIASAALAVVFIAPTMAASESTTITSPLCSAAEYHQLDFWIGDWNTFETDAAGGPSIAHAGVTPIAEGCAIHELYEQTDGLVGDSILSYDPARKQWQQTWVTNRGSIMVLWGDFRDGVLILEGEVHLRDGTSLMQRITWKAQGKGVRESAVLSKDGGQKWTPAFDVLFLKR
jgi:hypothetical protein